MFGNFEANVRKAASMLCKMDLVYQTCMKVRKGAENADRSGRSQDLPNPQRFLRSQQDAVQVPLYVNSAAVPTRRVDLLFKNLQMCFTHTSGLNGRKEPTDTGKKLKAYKFPKF